MSKEKIKDRLKLQIEREKIKLKESEELSSLKKELSELKAKRRGDSKTGGKVMAFLSNWAEKQRKEKEEQRKNGVI